MRVAIGSDHAGYLLKETLKAGLIDAGVALDDAGTTGDASVDYPDYAEAVARLVVSGACDRGILICGSGVCRSLTGQEDLAVAGPQALAFGAQHPGESRRRSG